MSSEQEFFQLAVSGWYFFALLFLVQQGRDGPGKGNIFANNGLNGIVEFDGMGGLEEETFFTRVLSEISLQGEVADGAVGVGEVMVMRIKITDGGGGFGVGDTDGGEGFAEVGELLAEQLEDADEVAGVANVHSVG